MTMTGLKQMPLWQKRFSCKKRSSINICISEVFMFVVVVVSIFSVDQEKATKIRYIICYLDTLRLLFTFFNA